MKRASKSGKASVQFHSLLGSAKNSRYAEASTSYTASGGGWVDASQPVFKVMNMCVFADGSAIDEFGIMYYAAGTVRGADLAPLFRYQPGNKLPAMFDEPRR